MHLPAPEISRDRLAQIDGLRFFAIVLVMLHHYMPHVQFPLFGQGVTLFFVLSGFFATRQLLRARHHVEAGDLPLGQAIGRFHLRRYLRIFPVYFLVVGLGILADLPYAREAAWWHLTFTSNWWVLAHGEWMGPFSPFWSLAVLEQFYLFWPTLLLCIPRRAMVAACLGLVAVAVTWRWYCYLDNLSGLYWLVVPAAGFDQLGLGALLAIAQEPGHEKLRRSLRQGGLWVGGALAFYLLLIAPRVPAGDMHAIYRPTVVALFLAAVVDRVAVGVPGAVGWVLGHAAARAGGRISYSIFAFHEFTAYLIPPLLRPEIPDVLEIGWRPWVLILSTCLLAAVVFLAVERPVLRLKTRLGT